jgi:hypothetical protein
MAKLKFSSATDPLVRKAAVRGFCHLPSLEAKPTLKQVSKPSARPAGLAPTRRPTDRMDRESGLRIKKNIQPPIAVQSGSYTESKELRRLYKARTIRYQLLAEILDTEGTILQENIRFDRRLFAHWRKLIEDRRLTQRTIQELYTSINGERRRIITPHRVSLFVSDIEHVLLEVEIESLKSIHQRRKSLEQKLATIEAEIDEREITNRDRESSIWRTNLERSWAETASMFGAQELNKRLAYSSGMATRLIADLLPIHIDFILRLSRYRFQNSEQDHEGELMYEISTGLMTVIEESLNISHEAHFLRSWRRISYFHKADPATFGHLIELTHRQEIQGRLSDTAAALRLHVMSFYRLFWSKRQGRVELRLIGRASRTTDLCWIMQRGLVSIKHDFNQFAFGVLSNHRTRTVQLRIAQIAAFEPFQTAIRNLNMLAHKTRELSRGWRRIHEMGWESLHLDISDMSPADFRELGVEKLDAIADDLIKCKRETLMELDVLMLLRGKLHKYQLSSRSPFLDKDTPPKPTVSPVSFDIPRWFPKSDEWKTHYYRSPDGERVKTFYCRETLSMDLALQQLDHGGIVSIDVRRARPFPREQPLRPWFGHDVTVVSIATQSQIVVCHFASLQRFHHDENIPDTLSSLLEDLRIVKVGRNIDRLRQRLQDYLGIYMTGTCDVVSLDDHLSAASKPGSASIPARKIGERSNHSKDLVGLVHDHFNLSLPKTEIESNDWLQDFSWERLIGMSPPLVCSRHSDLQQASHHKLMLVYACFSILVGVYET